MNRCGIFAVAAGLCLGAAGVSQAAVVFEQLPNYSNGFFSDSAGNYPWQRIAENFTLGAGTSIGQVGAWGVYFPNNTMIDNFTVNFYADAGNNPGVLLHSVAGSASSIDTGVDAFGCDVYESTITLNSAFNAAAGTQYWVSIVNSTGLGSDWAWITASADSVGRWTPDYGASWLDLGSDLSLRLYEVPAPSSLALLGLGGLIAGRRRR
ncbi:MAG: PEP-CTERM sorting domain-containing protein [Phycisphaerales bacterium]